MNKQELMHVVWTGTLRTVLVVLLTILGRKGDFVSIFFMVVLVDVHFYWKTKLNEAYKARFLHQEIRK